MAFYNDEITPACAHCAHGAPGVDGKLVLCPKKGIMLPDDHCNKYRYDVFKRVPRQAPVLPQYEHAMFSLEDE